MRFQQVIDVSGRRLGLAGVVFTSEGIEHGIQGSVIRIFLFAGLIALVGLALASVLVYQVSRPIHLLVEGVKKFGASFDPEIPESANVKIEFRSFNEIGDVRDSFNEMTTALRVSMAERKALKEESGYLRMQATTDALTELYNKRQFEEDYPNLVELAAARERPLCLLMLDMDRFKELNDTKGHAAGDQALKDLAQAIRDRTRSSERAYRLGGDEFIIISVGTGIDDARAIAGRIAEEYDRRKASGNLTTISFGIVSYDGLKTHEELLHAADQEMYRVKREKKSER
jgi:diguanylate cyclase (GGDEF)-like protein